VPKYDVVYFTDYSKLLPGEDYYGVQGYDTVMSPISNASIVSWETLISCDRLLLLLA